MEDDFDENYFIETHRINIKDSTVDKPPLTF